MLIIVTGFEFIVTIMGSAEKYSAALRSKSRSPRRAFTIYLGIIWPACVRVPVQFRVHVCVTIFPPVPA